MERNSRRRSRNSRHNWNDTTKNKNTAKQNQNRLVQTPENRQELIAKEKAIRDFKARQVICPMCGQPITELSSALADKTTGVPVHFDCVLTALGKNEQLKDNERLTYIGQGRFAVLSFENPRDLRHFKIERIIEWEEHNKALDWRVEMAGLYSHVD